MSDEQKKVEDCKKCECCKLVCKFFFLSGAVFFGTLMALLFAHALLKPNCPPCHSKMMGPHRPGIERQMPPQMIEHRGQMPNFKMHPGQMRMHKRPDVKGQIPQEGRPIK